MNKVTIGKISFRNPVISASGTYGMGDVFTDFVDYSKIGGITLKTVTRKPRIGNTPPRILETPSGLLNSIGLENEGFNKVLTDLKKEDYLKKYKTNVIFSIAGDSAEDYFEMAAALSAIEGIAIFELNLSCPNIHDNGRNADSDPKNVEKIVKGTANKTAKPFSVKLSPHNDFISNSKIIEDNGGHAVTISNTFLGTAIDIKTKKFIFNNKVAGFSGPAVKPMALWNVYRTAQSVKIPVIASGGISNIEDAVEFIIAGASLVSIGTMNFVDPDICVTIANGLEKYFSF